MGHPFIGKYLSKVECQSCQKKNFYLESSAVLFIGMETLQKNKFKHFYKEMESRAQKALFEEIEKENLVSFDKKLDSLETLEKHQFFIPIFQKQNCFSPFKDLLYNYFDYQIMDSECGYKCDNCLEAHTYSFKKIYVFQAPKILAMCLK